jgi:hypothetical protein
MYYLGSPIFDRVPLFTQCRTQNPQGISALRGDSL